MVPSRSICLLAWELRFWLQEDLQLMRLNINYSKVTITTLSALRTKNMRCERRSCHCDQLLGPREAIECAWIASKWCQGGFHHPGGVIQN